MPRMEPPRSFPGSPPAEGQPRTFRVGLQRLQAGVTIPRALAYLALVGLAVLFLWLTLRVDLVIFGGVLFAISFRRAAEALSRLIKLPVGWSLLVVVLLILSFFSAIGWFFSQAIASQINQLSQQLPAAAEKVGNMISQSSLGQTLRRSLRATLAGWCSWWHRRVVHGLPRSSTRPRAQSGIGCWAGFSR
jgi:predicted PurR-regulated permease PerM